MILLSRPILSTIPVGTKIEEMIHSGTDYGAHVWYIRTLADIALLSYPKVD